MKCCALREHTGHNRFNMKGRYSCSSSCSHRHIVYGNMHTRRGRKLACESVTFWMPTYDTKQIRSPSLTVRADGLDVDVNTSNHVESGEPLETACNATSTAEQVDSIQPVRSRLWFGGFGNVNIFVACEPHTLQTTREKAMMYKAIVASFAIIQLSRQSP